MSWADRIGKAFTDFGQSVNDSIDDGVSAVGAAWSAANSDVPEGHWLSKPAQPIQWLTGGLTDATMSGLGNVGEALNWAYSYGVARPVSTVTQMNPTADITQASNYTKLTSAEAWNEAWNRSETISPGQALVTNTFDVWDIGPDWATKGDPYGKAAASEREEFFRNTWWGKLSSGSIDAVAVIASDPGYLLLKGARKAQVAKTTVDAEDTEAVLAKAAQTTNRPAVEGWGAGVSPTRTLEDGTELTRRQADQGQRASELIDRIVAKPRREIQAMPELQGHADANSLAILMQRAKDTHPNNPAEQRKAIADVLGTAWGDSAAMTRLTARRDQLAVDAQRIVSPPPQNLWQWRMPGYRPIYDQAAVRAVAAQRKLIDDEMGRLDDVLANSGQGLGPTRVGSTAIERAAEGNALRAVNESWLHTGFASAPIRMVTSAAGTRIPGHIRTKDAAGGYDDMVNTLRLMRYTAPETKQKIMDSFVRASTPAHRMNVVDFTRKQMVTDAARKYGLTDAQAKVLLQAGEGRMSDIRNRLSSRLYSAAGDSRFVQEADAEDDAIHLFDKPFLQSMLEDAHPMIDPREVDTAIRIASKSRLLDNLGGPGTMVSDGFGTVKDVSLDALNMSTKFWKTAALALRGAYPLRVMTDTQARQAVHMETQVFMATRYHSVGALKTYLITNKDGPERSLKNIFKEGNTEEAVTKMLTRDLGLGSQWNLTPDDVPGIVRNVMQNDGGMADLANEVGNVLLRKRRTGDFSVIEPNNPDWAAGYKRAVNLQILNSPVAIQALSTPDIYELKRLVRTVPALMKEARDVGAKYDNQEDWLGAVVAANNHLLPTPELRELAMRRAARLQPEARDAARVAATARLDAARVEHERIAEQFRQGLVSASRRDRAATELARAERNLERANRPSSGFSDREIHDLFAGKRPRIKPMPIHGEGFSVEAQGKFVEAYNKVRNGFFKFAAEMPENTMGRSPLFWDSYRQQLSATLARLDDDQIAQIGVDTIRKNAMNAARKRVGQILFDSSSSSNMASSMRLLSPFFSAWEDTMTKWGKLFYDQPELFARVNQGSQMLNDTGTVVDQNGFRLDANGNAFDSETGERVDNKAGYEKGGEFIFLPHKYAKYLGSEGGVKIRKDSINSVFQGEPWWLPGFGPLVGVPVNRITREMFPKEINDPVIKYILPYGTTNDSELKQLAPKWIKSAMNAFGTGYQHQNQYKIFLAEATIDARNGGPKVDLDKIANKTRNYFLLKSAIDNVSPVSILATPKNQFYIDKAHEYSADKTRQDWAADFDRDFPGFGEMKLELSSNETGIQATDAAYDAQKRYSKDIDKDPEFGWLFVGPANAPGVFNGAVHDWQVAHGYRTQKKPYQALKELEAEQGWTKYNKFRMAVSLVLEERGLQTLQQKGAEDLQFAVQEYRKILGEENKSWGEEQLSAGSGNKPQLMLNKAREFMEKHPERAKDPDMRALDQYIKVRAAIVFELQNNREFKSLERNPDLEYALKAYGQSLAASNLGFETMWNRVLEYDNLTKDLE